MSTDNDKKRDKNVGDWDSALEEWDEAPLVPSLPEDRTPSPPEAKLETTEPADEIPPDSPPASKSTPFSLVEDEDDEESTMVGEIPAELIANSIRGMGRASGLGQLFAAGIKTQKSADESEDKDIDLDAAFGLSPAHEDSGEAFESTPPAAADVTPIPIGDVPSSRPEDLPQGPKLLEPEERKFSLDDETGAFMGDLNADVRGRETAKPPPDTPLVDESLGMARSVPPPPVDLPKPRWSDERDASAHLLERKMRDEWEDRTVWIAEEAAERDAEQRARMMLAMSEFCAMVGDDEKAVAIARAARDLSKTHPLIQRQCRYTMVRDRQWADVLDELEEELRNAPTPEAKSHCLIQTALLKERLHVDEEASLKLYDQAARITPSDPRPYVEKFIRYLNDETGEVSSTRWPENEALQSLSSGVDMVNRLRDAQQVSVTPGQEIGIYEAIPRAKAALRESDTNAAVLALRALEGVRGLSGGASWLMAVLAGQQKQSRPQALEALAKSMTGPHASVAARLMALRAVESGNVEALAKALETTSSDAFSVADRVVLSALFHQDPDAAEPFVTMLFGREPLVPLASAARAALTPVNQEHAQPRMESASVGDERQQAKWALARALAAGVSRDEFEKQSKALFEADPETWIGKLLDMDLAIDGGDSSHIVNRLASWNEDGADQQAERDRALAAGLAAELLADKERAAQEYRRAIEADPSHEGAIRALRALGHSDTYRRLGELAGLVEDPARAAVLLIETALGIGPKETDYPAFLRQSHQLDPSLPFAPLLGEHAARSIGDADGVLDWLRTRREATQDPLEAAYDACREAMLMVERDISVASSLMEQASRTRPSDFVLRALFERFSSSRPEDWGAWRVERATETDGPEKARLLTEAALESERMNQIEEAAKLAQQALEAGAGGLAERCLERCELAGAASSSLTDALIKQARQEDISVENRREVQERLAELDEMGRRDIASALLWHRTILEHSPQHLPSLRRIEHAYVGMGRDDELEPIATELSKVLQGPEVDAHVELASRLRLRDSSWGDLAELSLAAARQPSPSLWALRAMFAQARVGGDDAALVQTAKLLSEKSDNEMESAALLVQAAQALARLGEVEEASQVFQVALEREPGFVQAHLELVDVLIRTGEHARAAEELEALARKSNVEAHRVELWHRAAVLWLDEVKDVDRGQHALEEASDIDITFQDTFEKLSSIYAKNKDSSQLALLLERRLDAVTDPQERLEMEVLRGRVLADIGEVSGAKRALAAALDASPDFVPALEVFADVCIKDEEWSGAEQALIRLARLAPDTEQQIRIYKQLGEIYLHHLPDPERAEAAFREVLKRNPDDEQTQGALVDVFRETGDAEKAVALCTTLIEQAKSPEDKRTRSIQLALIHEQLEGEPKKAHELLERLYKQAPSAAAPLRALAEFHQRQGNDKPLEQLIDRATKDTARALRTGRFSQDLFATLEAVAAIKGDGASARVAGTVVKGLEGEPAELLPSFGLPACSVNIDDILAPSIVSAPLRALLKRTGRILEAAFPMDLKSMRAAPLPPSVEELQAAVIATAATMGLDGLVVLSSPALGPTCIPIGSDPPTIVMGASLLNVEDEGVRDFLIVRALKVIQTRGAVLSRTAPIDLMPLVAALIKTIAPSYEPSGIDARRFSDSLQKLKAAKPQAIDPDTAALALEYASSLDNRASTLNVAINGWGDRAALLAQGDLPIALKGIAWAGGHPSGPPTSGRDRMNWIGRNAEARDLIVFIASDSYADACRRLRG